MYDTQVERALRAFPESPWFLGGDHPSLVDCIFAPKIERVIAACLYWKGMKIRRESKYSNLSK